MKRTVESRFTTDRDRDGKKRIQHNVHVFTIVPAYSGSNEFFLCWAVGAKQQCLNVVKADGSSCNKEELEAQIKEPKFFRSIMQGLGYKIRKDYVVLSDTLEE